MCLKELLARRLHTVSQDHPSAARLRLRLPPIVEKCREVHVETTLWQSELQPAECSRDDIIGSDRFTLGET